MAILPPSWRARYASWVTHRMRAQSHLSNQPPLLWQGFDMTVRSVRSNWYQHVLGELVPRISSLQKSQLQQLLKYLLATPCLFPNSGRTSCLQNSPEMTWLRSQLSARINSDCLALCARSRKHQSEANSCARPEDIEYKFRKHTADLDALPLIWKQPQANAANMPCTKSSPYATFPFLSLLFISYIFKNL